MFGTSTLGTGQRHAEDPLVDISEGMPPVPLTHASQSSDQAASGGRGGDGAPSATDSYDGASLHPRLQAVIVVGRYHGIELDPGDYKSLDQSPAPSAQSLSAWVQNAGLWSRALRLRWRNLLGLQDAGPVILLLNDGSAALLTGANPDQKVVYLKDPQAAESAAPVAVDALG